MKLITFLSLIMFNTLQVNNQQDSFKSLSTENVEVQKLIVDRHNYCRRNVQPTASNMFKMIWNNEAARNADRHAKKCLWVHSSAKDREVTNLTCGENIFIAPIQLNWERVIGIYDSEKENFVYGEGAKSPDRPVGHYTQLVWDRSFFLGCAIAYCPSNNPPTYNYVCQYCPAGNVNSLNFPYKSGQPCEDCTESCSDNLCISPCPYTDFFSNCAELKEKCQDPDIYKRCTATCSCNSEIV